MKIRVSTTECRSEIRIKNLRKTKQEFKTLDIKVYWGMKVILMKIVTVLTATFRCW